KEVPVEIIREIIRDTCMAPSSGNGQPWEFIVVNSREVIRKISDESKANLVSGIEADPNSPLKKYEAALRDPAFNVFYNAPSLVIIAGPADVRSLAIDCSLAAAYFMLAAANRGLGTCWVALGSDIRNPELLKEIGADEGLKIVAPIILGYPQGPIPEPVRNPPRILKVIG
ncbi:MAG TPA: nitroreductase family protein, partial [Thermodesulfobacteriota bacterium]|nr:nitroreductase family protein [Thermodesulfobacteriota bacterium]